jgi:D-glycero-alpha-D-manno-heptose-7-phosphate kinase
VVESFVDHGLGGHGVDLFIATEVAPGTGLGSSSAVAVGLVQALATFLGMSLSPAEVAEAASVIEIERLGMPIGRQDQYASAFGGLNTIEFMADGVTVRPLEIAPDLARELGARLMLFATGRSRNSASILHQQQEDTRANPAVVERLHRLKSLAHEMRQALFDEKLDDFGGLLDRAWREKRALSANISTGAIDRWYEAARAAGALGGKITGAGGGGYLLLYAAPERQPAVRQVMRDFGLQEMPFDFDYHGARVVGKDEG